jgi:hypothetical protein
MRSAARVHQNPLAALFHEEGVYLYPWWRRSMGAPQKGFAFGRIKGLEDVKRQFEIAVAKRGHDRRSDPLTVESRGLRTVRDDFVNDFRHTNLLMGPVSRIWYHLVI